MIVLKIILVIIIAFVALIAVHYNFKTKKFRPIDGGDGIYTDDKETTIAIMVVKTIFALILAIGIVFAFAPTAFILGILCTICGMVYGAYTIINKN